MNDPHTPTVRLARILPTVAAPGAIAVLTVAGAVQTHRPPPITVALGIVVIVTGALLARIDAAGGKLIVGLAVLAASVSAACWGDARTLGWFGMCVIAGWAALVLPARSAVGAGGALAATFVVMLALSGEPEWVTWTFGVALTTGAFVVVRRQRMLVDQLHAVQSELTERARRDERHRIAREMHDLVGHSLTVALLQLGSARLALDDDVDSARSALAEAERAARDSLDDVRATLGLMRGSDSQAQLPIPGVGGIPALVDSYRHAGAQIDLDVRGPLQTLAASRGLAVSRIVQESLTNAVRHGDQGPITVCIHVDGERTCITVRNGLTSCRPRPPGTGITGMTERATALGGTLSAGPDADAWLVEAVIPV